MCVIIPVACLVVNSRRDLGGADEVEGVVS